MATIKLNAEKKIITKSGKVSCGCCGPCCMYPARALWEGKYSVDDLPDVIVASSMLGDIELYKGVWSNDISLLGTLAAAGAFWGRSEPHLDEAYIAFKDGYSDSEGWSLGPWPFGWAGFDCLIHAYTLQGQDYYNAKDEFADTYTITGPISGTVTRSKGDFICIWRGNNLILRYDSFQIIESGTVYGKGLLKFKVNGSPKIGFQNTPVGSYAGGFTVS